MRFCPRFWIFRVSFRIKRQSERERERENARECGPFSVNFEIRERLNTCLNSNLSILKSFNFGVRESPSLSLRCRLCGVSFPLKDFPNLDFEVFPPPSLSLSWRFARKFYTSASLNGNRPRLRQIACRAGSGFRLYGGRPMQRSSLVEHFTRGRTRRCGGNIISPLSFSLPLSLFLCHQARLYAPAHTRW